MKTLHLGPDELLVAAKIAVTAATAAPPRSRPAIDAAERADPRRRADRATVIYLEPDIYRDDYVGRGAAASRRRSRRSLSASTARSSRIPAPGSRRPTLVRSAWEIPSTRRCAAQT